MVRSELEQGRDCGRRELRGQRYRQQWILGLPPGRRFGRPDFWAGGFAGLCVAAFCPGQGSPICRPFLRGGGLRVFGHPHPHFPHLLGPGTKEWPIGLLPPTGLLEEHLRMREVPTRLI